MNEPLDEHAKKIIEAWGKEKILFSNWMDANLDVINTLYSGKETYVQDGLTHIEMPIKRIIADTIGFRIEGENFHTRVIPEQVIFNEDYSMTIKKLYGFNDASLGSGI